MLKNKTNIKGIIFDFDSLIINAQNNLNKFKNHNIQIDILSSYSTNNLISKSEIMHEIKNLLYSISILKIKIGIVTNNKINLIKTLFKNNDNICQTNLIIIPSVKTSNFLLSKKDIILTALKMNIDLCNIMIVGNNYFYSKIETSLEMQTLHLSSLTRNKKNNLSKPNFIINKLSNILPIIKKNILFSTGKLPNYILNILLLKYKFEDQSVIIGPSIGEDTTAINIQKEEILVIKSDPVTFSTSNIGQSVVLINNNDIATSGATAKWMLTTIMFPEYSSLYEISKIFKDLYDTCSSYGITLCGGHTEITNVISKPIISATIIGTVKYKNLINKKRIKTNDIIIMTKGIAAEGTAIIASEFKNILHKKGMSDHNIKKCLMLQSKISILPEANIAKENKGVSALHDVTEGGIATALAELTQTSRHGMNILLDKIVIYPQTKILCDLMKIDPLGLLGSGSLLICCNPDSISKLLHDMKNKNILATIIGKITNINANINAFKYKKPDRFPKFETDEITRLFNNKKTL